MFRFLDQPRRIAAHGRRRAPAFIGGGLGVSWPALGWLGWWPALGAGWGWAGRLGDGRPGPPPMSEALSAGVVAASDPYRRASCGMRRPGRKAVAAGAMGARRTRRGRPVWCLREGLRAGPASACHLRCSGTRGPGPPGQVPAVLDRRLNRASVTACNRHARDAGSDRAIDHRQRVPGGVGLAGAIEPDRSARDAGRRAAADARVDLDPITVHARRAVRA